MCVLLLLKNVVCFKFVKNIVKMPLTRNQCYENTRGFWVHPIYDLHIEKGEFYTLYQDLRHFQPKFDRLLALVGPHLEKKWTKMRSPLPPAQKLVIMLR